MSTILSFGNIVKLVGRIKHRESLELWLGQDYFRGDCRFASSDSRHIVNLKSFVMNEATKIKHSGGPRSGKSSPGDVISCGGADFGLPHSPNINDKDPANLMREHGGELYAE